MTQPPPVNPTPEIPGIPAGLYTNPATGQTHWWDGARWSAQPPPSPPITPPAPPVAPATSYGLGATPAAPSAPATTRPKFNRLAVTALIIGAVAFLLGLVPVLGGLLSVTAIVLGAVVLARRLSPAWMGGTALGLGGVAFLTSVVIIAVAVNGGAVDKNNDTASVSESKPTASSKPSPRATTTPAPEPEMVAVPAGLVGMTANDASAALVALGLKAVYDGEATAKVLSISPADAELVVGTTITLTVEQPPVLTLSQKNAAGQAQSYLSFSNFSRTGLIDQLLYEGYSAEDATFAVDFVNPDWNAQAAGQAESYLSFSSFSREGLYDQLIYEGYTPDQANEGLAAVGY